jgi:predicted RNase H-like HicB family nuclease
VVPSLPGCFTQGDTVEETIKFLREAITGWIESRVDLSWEIPEPDISKDNIEVVQAIDVSAISNFSRIRYA